MKQHYEERGYRVRSREKDNLGYDLDVTKGSQVFHVEVKGVAGTKIQFPISANEVRCAKTDPHFRLAVVTAALSPRDRKITYVSASVESRHHIVAAVDFSPN